MHTIQGEKWIHSHFHPEMPQSDDSKQRVEKNWELKTIKNKKIKFTYQVLFLRLDHRFVDCWLVNWEFYYSAYIDILTMFGANSLISLEYSTKTDNCFIWERGWEFSCFCV